jgi:RNA polymerase sigma-70 factor, ECF subfamily
VYRARIRPVAVEGAWRVEPQAGTASFASFYDATSGAAYGLAYAIARDHDAASAACEAAYLDHWQANGPELTVSLAGQTAFLQRVRWKALVVRNAPPLVATHRSDPPQSTYSQRDLVRAELDALEPFARRTLELAYFGGLTVTEIAEVSGVTPSDIRQALRTALLTLGRAAPQEEAGR